MRNPCAKLSKWKSRQWTMAGLAGLIVIVAAILIVPQLWAWYHYRAGISAMDRYHSADAVQHFDSCLTVWRRSIPARVLAARASRRLGDYATARDRLNECQNLLKGTNPEVALEDALLRTTMGDLGGFESALRTRMEREPQRAPLILEALAEGYARMYRLLESMTCLTQWLDVDPDNVQALYLRGRASQQIRTWEKAANDFRKAVGLDAERVDARERLVVCLLEISRFEEALGHLEHLQRARPDDADLQVRIARCHHGMGQVKRPRQILEAVVTERPDHGPALLLLGKIILSAGQPEDAEEPLRKAARALPYDYQAQWQLYQSLNRQEGKTAEAQAQLLLAESLRHRHERLTEITTKLSVRPHDAALHYEMGTLLMQLGNRELGARWLSSALQEQSDHSQARDALIAYFEEIGNTEEVEQLRRDTQAPSQVR